MGKTQKYVHDGEEEHKAGGEVVHHGEVVDGEASQAGEDGDEVHQQQNLNKKVNKSE